MSTSFTADIPAEIRDKIFAEIFKGLTIYVHREDCNSHNNVSHIHGTFRKDNHTITNLFLSCRLVHREAKPFLWKHATFEAGYCTPLRVWQCTSGSLPGLVMHAQDLSNASVLSRILQWRGKVQFPCWNSMVENTRHVDKQDIVRNTLSDCVVLTPFQCGVFLRMNKMRAKWTARVFGACTIYFDMAQGKSTPCLVSISIDTAGKFEIATAGRNDLEELRKPIDAHMAAMDDIKITYCLRDVSSSHPYGHSLQHPYFSITRSMKSEW